MPCAVCQKHQTYENLPGKAVFQNAHLFIAHFPSVSEEPAHYGHVIIEMKKHIISPAQMTEEEAADLGIWIHKLSRALESSLGAEHTYVVRIGDKTKHLHFHLVPRFAGTPQEFWGPLLFRWAGGRKATPQDMIQITGNLRNFLQLN